MVESLIALGSNVGDRAANLRRAIGLLRSHGEVTVVSSVYETEPMYLEDQGWFLNCVVALETRLTPGSLLDVLKGIEAAMGRERSERYGPRSVDLDILFYGEVVLSEPGLDVPHPRLAERMFVLAPLTEIRPDFVHPVLDLTISQLLSALKTDKKVVKRPDLLKDLVS